MNSLKSLIIMMSLYTRLPMPQIEWEDKLLKRVLLFLPAAGMIIGAAEALWLFPFAGLRIGVDARLFSAAACIIPVALTGGIHLDGLADSADALASWGSPEKKRTILRDPHIGTFGVLALILYIFVQAVLMNIFFERSFFMSQISFRKPALLLGSIFVLSRAVTQIAIAWIPPSAEEGMLYRFSSVTGRKVLGLTGLLLLLVGQGIWFLEGGPAGLLLLPCMALHLLLFRRKMIRQFGGLSGDLCGRLIQLSELWMLGLLCFLLAAGKIWMYPEALMAWFS